MTLVIEARAYCDVCSWSKVETIDVPSDVRMVGLDAGPRLQVEPCGSCGGRRYVDLRTLR